MINTVTGTKSELTISTVEEKILLEKQLPFNPENKKGPTVDLYFHELTSDKSFSQQGLSFIGSVLIGMIFLITLPVIGLFIKLSSREPVFRKVNVPGQRGIVFQQYRYSTKHSDTGKSFTFGTFLHESKLEKIPSIINIWRGEMELVGPRPYPADWCNRWNRELSDFYKRFAQKPGFFTITDPIYDHENEERIANSLKKELSYILNPTLKEDVRRLLKIR